MRDQPFDHIAVFYVILLHRIWQSIVNTKIHACWAVVALFILAAGTAAFTSDVPEN